MLYFLFMNFDPCVTGVTSWCLLCLPIAVVSIYP